MDTKKIYNLVAATKEEKRSWIESVDKLINHYLEVEKIKEEQLAEEQEIAPVQLKPSLSRGSTSNLEIPKSPVARRQTNHTRPGTVSYTSPPTKSPTCPTLPSQSPQPQKKIMDTKTDNMEKRMLLIEKTMQTIVEENEALRKKVADLEASLTKQGKELRKLKKRDRSVSSKRSSNTLKPE